MMNNVKLDISGIVARVQFENIEIKKYLEKEFKYFISEEKTVSYKRDINIIIESKKFVLPHTCVEKDKDIFLDKEGTYIQRIRAKDHVSWVTYRNRFEEITLFIEYNIKDNLYEALLNPNFSCKWTNCLIDFFHGPFLGIIQVLLLKNNKSFFHAAAFNKGNKAIVLTGEGQSGKSSIVKYINKNGKGEVLSEDFCILDLNNKVISYPKQARVSRFEFRNSSFFKNQGYGYKILEMINFYMFNSLKCLGVSVNRRLDFDNMFTDNQVTLENEIGLVAVIRRDCKELRLVTINKSEFVNKISDMMLVEFKNLPAFIELNFYINQQSEKELEEEILTFYNKIYDNEKCIVLELPFDNRKEYLDDILPSVLKKLEEEKKNGT